MAGLFGSFYEIFEIIVVVFILLIVSTAILISTNPNYMQAYATSSELSYVSTLIEDKNFQVDLEYKDTKLSKEGDLIVISYKDATVKKNYFGTNVKIEQIDENKFRLETIT